MCLILGHHGIFWWGRSAKNVKYRWLLVLGLWCKSYEETDTIYSLPPCENEPR